MTNTSTEAPFVRMAGLLCLLGALLGMVITAVAGLVPSSVPPENSSYPYTWAGFLAAQFVLLLNRALLLVGIVGLAKSGTIGTGLLGRIGLSISAIGMLALGACEVGAMMLVAADLMGTAYGIATLLIGVGLTLAGVGVARTGEWPGWRRYVTLACGIAVFVAVVPGIVGSFRTGQLALTAWMLLFAALGWALYSHSRMPIPAPAHAR